MMSKIAKMISRVTCVVIVVAVAMIMVLSSVSISALFYPNDYDHDEQYGLDYAKYTYAWDLAGQGQKFTNPGSNQIVVAVIGNGCDLTEPDLAANLWVNPFEVRNNGIDEDGRSYIDDYYGMDFWNDDGDSLGGSEFKGEDPPGNGNDDGDYWVDTDDDDTFDFYSDDGAGYHNDIIFLDSNSNNEFDVADDVLRDVGGLSATYQDPSTPINQLVDEDGNDPEIFKPDNRGNSGTYAAAVVAEITNNGLQCAGGAQISVMILKVRHLDLQLGDVETVLENMADAIEYAATMGADIITFSDSFRDGVLGVDLNPLINELNDAWDSGILIFAPAGDHHLDEVHYPAYDENVVAVGASNKGGPGWPESTFSYGVETEIIAAGIDVPMLDVQDSGSRYSSSLAASAAAIVCSYRPSWENSQVRALLHATASPFLPSDYEWASKDHNGQTYCRGYGEVDVFDALRIANYAHDWWNEEEVISRPIGTVKMARQFRPDIAIDRHGNSHIVWCQWVGGSTRLYYNSFSARGERIFLPDVLIYTEDTGHQPEWLDIEVGIADLVYIIWAPTDDFADVSTIWYTQLLRGETLVAPKCIYNPYSDPESPYRYPQFLNLMISEHPHGHAHIVFNVQRWNGATRTGKVAYLPVDPDGNPGDMRQIYPDPDDEPNNIDTRGVSADLGRVPLTGGGREDRVMYVYEEYVTVGADNWDVFWNSYVPSTDSNLLAPPLLLRPPIEIPGGQRFDWELCPDVSVDLMSAQSFVIWKRRVRTANANLDYDILEYTWLKHDGTDLTCWSESGGGGDYGAPGTCPYKIRVSQIGEPSDHVGFYGSYWDAQERQKEWPRIAYNTHSAKWDHVGFQYPGEPLSYSTITWAEKTDDGWGIYYSDVMPNGREILPDADPTDRALNGEAILIDKVTVMSQGPPALDSGFESSSSVYDETGNIDVVWVNDDQKLSFISSKEFWQTDAHLVEEVEPDLALDSDDNFHVSWETDGAPIGVQYRSWFNPQPGIANPRFATRDVSNNVDLIISKDPQILVTNEEGSEKVHILWIEDKNIDELYYRRYDVNGNPETNDVLVGFMPQNRGAQVLSFTIYSFEMGYDTEEQMIHVIYNTHISLDTTDPYVPENLRHGSISPANVVYHSEAIVTNIGSQDATAAVEVGTDSTPCIVYNKFGDIYYQRLNPETTGSRVDPTMPYPVQLDDGGSSTDYVLPNLAIDRDTIRNEDSIVDWDEPVNNDRFIHVVYYGMGNGGMGTNIHLYYTKIDRDGNVMVAQKQVGESGGLTVGAVDLCFPDMVIDSDNRVGVVATGTLQPGSWLDIPDMSIYYIKLDNNGEVLTANTLMNTIEAVYINNVPSGIYTYEECRRPRIAINGINEVHMVFEKMIGDSPPVPNIYHTRHYLENP